MKKNWLMLSFLTFFTGFILFACSPEESTIETNEGEEISVVASFYPMYEFTQQIVGDRANVTLMVSEGEDAHHYEPSAQDVATVNDSDVFVYSSEEMEFWVDSLLDTIENDELVVSRAADSIEETNFLEVEESSTQEEQSQDHEEDLSHENSTNDHDEHDHGGMDAHIWLDPLLAQDQVNEILEGLIEADPDGEEVYIENAEAFIEELQDLHEEFEAAFEGAENRVFVVQHQAFGHIANRYDLEQISIGGLSTEVEASPSRIAEIGEIVEEYDVPVIYYQQGANSATAQTVADETDTDTAVLHDLEVLSEELIAQDLGYLEAMRENLDALQLSIQ